MVDLNLTNITMSTSADFYAPATSKLIEVHAISGFDIFMSIGAYVFLCYLWVQVNKDKEKWSKWVNPSGKEVDVYNIIKKLMIFYPIVVVIMGILQILLFTSMVG